MYPISSFINTFLGAGFTSAIVGFLAETVDPKIAAIIWTYPFTIIIPIYFMHKDGKTHNFISKYLISQLSALVLLIIVFIAMAYFIRTASRGSNIIFPLFKATGVWGVCSLIFYFVMDYLGF